MANKNAQGYLLHTVLTRIRIMGEGYLEQTLYSVNETKSFTLANKELTAVTDRDLDTKANFTNQSIKLRIKVTGYGNYFNASRIILFIKPVAEAYPG
jgi:hypothetical protein